jgi:hypothetical protein
MGAVRESAHSTKKSNTKHKTESDVENTERNKAYIV